MIVPVDEVTGVGAVAEPIPPEAPVYHNKPVPVAVSGEAAWFWQSCKGVLTTGAAGLGYMVTTMGIRGLSHWFPIVWLT